MSVDFRSRQLRVNQIINSGSLPTSPMLIYGLGSATDQSGGFNVSHFTTGSDTWLFISGTAGSKNTTRRGVVTFGGDIHVSGTIYGGNISGSGVPGGVTTSIQFKDSGGTFGGGTDLTWDKVSSILTLTGTLLTTGIAQFAGGYGNSGVTISPSGNTSMDGILTVDGKSALKADVTLGSSISNRLTVNAYVTSSIIPSDNVAFNLGSPSLHWANIYTGDLHLRNDRGDWTVVEENDFLRIVNNKTGKNYRMVMEPIDD